MSKIRRKLAVFLVVVFLMVTFVPSVFASMPAVEGYIDIAGHWAEEAINKWSEKGIIYGYNGRFNPDSDITRAEFCAIINRIFGFTEKSSTNFDDVKPDKWYADDVAIAKKAGYIAGYGNNLFGPEDRIIRQDAARILFTVFQFDVADGLVYGHFEDNSEISSYAKEAVAVLTQKGYIFGYQNYFKPKDNLTRAQLIAILDRIVAELYNKPGTYSGIETEKNIIVSSDEVILENMVIEGNLYLAEGIGEGSVTLNNVTVKDNTFVNGGGENSVIIKDSNLGRLAVRKPDGKIRIVASGSTKVSHVRLNSGAILKADNIKAGFDTVEVLEIPEGQNLVIEGDFEDILVTASNASIIISGGTVNNLTISEEAFGAGIQIAQGALVRTLDINAAVNVEGQGKIVTANINAGNVTISQKPYVINIADGIEANIGGKKVDKSTVSESSKGGTTPGTPKQEWTLVWADEFDGDTVDTSKWELVDMGGGFGNQESQYYSPDNVTVEDGKLVITARKEKHPNATYEEYTSAKLVSKFAKKYGRIEARIKLPLGTGLWPAFWMMPQDSVYGGWAASGEIDIMEARGRVPDVVCGTLHYGGPWPHNVHTGKDYVFPEGQTINEFHTYAIEWEPGEIRWYVDGVHYQTQTSWYTMGSEYEETYAFPAPFDQEFYMQLNLAIGGTFDGMQLPPDELFEDPDNPVTMEVDYVRVYELTGRPYKTPEGAVVPVEPLPDNARTPDATGNLVYDVNFEKGIKDNQEGIDDEFGDYWNYVHNAQFGGEADVTVEEIDGNNYAKIDVKNKGSQPYSIQLEQLTTLGIGRWYRFSFDAKADKIRTLNTKLGGGPTRGWTAYSGSYTVDLTDEFQHFEFEFQMIHETDVLTRIEFNCATDTGPVWIGNVRLEEIDGPTVDYNAPKEPLSSGNHVYNGAFDKYSIDRMACWNVEVTGANADIYVPEDTRELTVKIKDGGASADTIVVYQQGIQLLNDYGYKLSFDARAAGDRTIKVAFTDIEGNVYVPASEISLTSGMKTYELEFKMEAETDYNSRLVFMLGGDSADVYIDNVELITTTFHVDPSVDLFPLKNGDFSDTSGEPWATYAVEGGVADFSFENGEARISTTVLGNNPWSIMLAQHGMKFSKGVEYQVEFDARANVPRDIEVILENAQYTRFFDETVSLTTEMQRFSFTFKMNDNQTLDLKFLLGNLEGALNTDIFIDNVICEVKGAKQYKNLLQNGTFATGTNHWEIFNADCEGASVEATVDDGTLNLAIGFEGLQFWSVQLIQDISTPLSAEKGYVLTFDISSSVEREIQAIVENINAPENKYLWETLNISSEKKTYSLRFSGVDDPAAHVVFAFGRIGDEPVGAAHTISISNISLIEDPYGFVPPPPPESHELLNGTFDENTDYWEAYTADGSDATISVENQKMKIDFANYDGWFIYSTQVYQRNIELKPNTTYTFGFEISSTFEKPILVSIEKGSDYNVKYLDTQEIMLTETEKTYTFEFTVGDVIEKDAKVVFQLGSNNVPGDQFVSHSIYIDNVFLTEKAGGEDPEPTEPEQEYGVDIMGDGNFETGIGKWDSWWGDEWSGGVTSGDAIVTDGKLKVTVDTIGTASYNPQIFRPNLTLIKGRTYKVTFRAMADKPWKINVNIGEPLDYDPWFIHYVDTHTFDLSTEEQEFDFTFKVPHPTRENIKFVFEVGKIGENEHPVTLWFDDVTVVPVEDQQEPPVDPDGLPTVWYLYNEAVDGICPAGEGLMSDISELTVKGWQPTKQITTEAAIWYSPVIDGTYKEGDWKFTLWTDEQPENTIINVALYKVNEDGSEEQLITEKTNDVRGSGNHPNEFFFEGIDAVTFENQRLKIAIKKIDGEKDVVMGYNPADIFKTMLETPEIQ